MPICDVIAREMLANEDSVIQLVFDTLNNYLISGQKTILLSDFLPENETLKSLNEKFKIYFSVGKSTVSKHVFNIRSLT